MGFLSGPVTFQCFRVNGEETRQFGAEHIKALKRFAIDRVETSSLEQADVGFLAGDHLLDCKFDLEKNVLGDALHCAVRVDSTQIPSAIRKAWLQIELATLAAENESGRPTKVQRLEAKEAVEARCQEEAQSGRFRRMQQFPVLWDGRRNLLFLGATSTTLADHCGELFARAFDLELAPLTAGSRAREWAAETKQRKAVEQVSPAALRSGVPGGEIGWCNHAQGNLDFLGNEMLLWLWWRLETQSDTIALPDQSEVVAMIARTLSLQCPRGESGKETITAEGPTHLPEAAQAIRSGKLPRKAGLILVRHGHQFSLTLQAESFAVGGAKIQIEEVGEGRGGVEDRVESVRALNETLDLLLRAFCERRLGKSWPGELEQIRRWLKSEPKAK